VAARAANPSLERAEQRTYDGGASYVGQMVDGKRQGLGVAILADGEKQAGDWQGDRLNGVGTGSFPADPLFAGQLRAGMPGGAGGFRVGRREGYGPVTGPAGKVRSGRWADGKALETTP